MSKQIPAEAKWLALDAYNALYRGPALPDECMEAALQAAAPSIRSQAVAEYESELQAKVERLEAALREAIPMMAGPLGRARLRAEKAIYPELIEPLNTVADGMSILRTALKEASHE